MPEKKPNILEVDGLIVNGRDGKPRASIKVIESDNGEERVVLKMHGAGNDEAAFHASVDAAGRTRLCVDYVGIDDRDFADVLTGIVLDSGNRKRVASFQVFGRGPGRHAAPIFEIPEHSEEGRRGDLVRAMLEAGEEYRDLPPGTIVDALEDVCEELCAREATS